MRMTMLAAALVAAAPAPAQVRLEPGQAVALTVAADGGIRVTATGRAELEPYDQAFVEQLREAYARKQELVLGATHDAPPIADDALQLRFITVDGKESVLALENGYDEGLVYRATITARGRTVPTDVCLVMPHKRGYEHWPFVIDRIELSGLERVAWKEGDPLPCK